MKMKLKKLIFGLLLILEVSFCLELETSEDIDEVEIFKEVTENEVPNTPEIEKETAAPNLKRHSLVRKRRQTIDSLGLGSSQVCDFGAAHDVTWCSWNSPENPKMASRSNDEPVGAPLRSSLPSSITSWTLSMGVNANWVGGPHNDTTGDTRGGYAFHETSSSPGKQAKMAVMESNIQGATGARGSCLKFWYYIDGLSANKLKVLVKGEDNPDNMILIWEAKDNTRGDWKEAQALYTFTGNHSIVVEAVPAKENDPFNIFRGHVAVDDLGIRPGSECIGLCSFEGGLCDWNNGINDDFDWELSRGTQNPITGPPRDRSSSMGNSLGGAYIYINSGFPRRPSDFARLESIEFQETDPNNPPCMRFYTFMSGKGVGSLRVILQDVVSRRERIIWAKAGNQGSRWLMAQIPLSSNSPFKVIFEGTVGIPRLGDIAIDDLTIISGPCATLPAIASPPNSGDCTFEEGLCGWTNPKPRAHLDNLDFARIQASELIFPNIDQTTSSSRGYYMALENPDKKLEADRAWFISPTMTGRRQIKCLSFWYMMFEPLSDTLEPNLGSLSAFLKREDQFGSIVLTPIWSMQNFQGLTWNYGQAPLRADGDFQVVLEGVWGSSESKGTIAIDDVTIFEGNCPTVPDAALVRAGDCTFTRGSCGWRNLTSDRDFYWSSASALRRPLNINDHTYGSPVGFIYFDIFNLNSRPQRLQLLSPVIEPSIDRTPICFTFWFTGFGADTNTTLRVYERPGQDSANQIVNTLNEDILVWEYKPLKARVNGWQFGQVSLVSQSRFQIIIEGSSFNGGFTLDDFKMYSGGCSKRPRDFPLAF